MGGENEVMERDYIEADHVFFDAGTLFIEGTRVV